MSVYKIIGAVCLVMSLIFLFFSIRGFAQGGNALLFIMLFLFFLSGCAYFLRGKR